MTYKPRRDYRFEYLWDAIKFIEERQCNNCVFKSDRPEYPMCFEIEAQLIEEKPVDEIDDLGDDGIVCRLFINES